MVLQSFPKGPFCFNIKLPKPHMKKKSSFQSPKKVEKTPSHLAVFPGHPNHLPPSHHPQPPKPPRLPRLRPMWRPPPPRRRRRRGCRRRPRRRWGGCTVDSWLATAAIVHHPSLPPGGGPIAVKTKGICKAKKQSFVLALQLIEMGLEIFNWQVYVSQESSFNSKGS